MRTLDFEPLDRAVPRVGVLGAARIVPKALVQVAEGLCELQAIAARDEGRAAAFAEAHGFRHHARSYDDLVSRPDIDVVYIALPTKMHATWAQRALASGKHVLCEKPFGLSAREAESCTRMARGRRRLLMEAHHACYHPLLERALDFAKMLGPIQQMALRFDGPIPPGDIRLDPALGAGVLLDFGCYLLKWQRLFSNDPFPRITRAEALQGAKGVDLAVKAQLRSRTGVRIRMECDMRPEVTFRTQLTLEGTRGRLEFENPLLQVGSVLRLDSTDRRLKVRGDGPSTYRFQLEAMHRALCSGRNPVTAGRSIVETQTMLDALVAACALAPKADALPGPRATSTG